MIDVNAKIDGAVIYWSAGPSQRDLLKTQLEQIGRESLLPNIRTNSGALKSALLAFCAGRKTSHSTLDIQPRKNCERDGFEILRVNRETQENGYSRIFGAKIEPIWQRLDVDGTLDDTDRATLADLYAAEKQKLTGQAIGQILVAALAQLGATTLRQSGGIYWIPGHACATFKSIADIVEACAEPGSANKIYLLRTPMDADTARAVRDAIVTEITSATDLINKDVRENVTAPHALRNRISAAQALRQRVREYENILGELMPTLHTAVDAAEQAAASATAQKNSVEVFSGLFD